MLYAPVYNMQKVLSANCSNCMPTLSSY